MTTRTKPHEEIQSNTTLPPFSQPPSTSAGQFLVRRYHVDPAFADLIANLAGLGSDLLNGGSL